MILQIRGTSGSGKTTMARWFLEQCTDVQHIMNPEKPRSKKPLLNICTYKGVKVALLGSYESKYGGTDTISTQKQICDLIEQYDNDGYHVLFEGLMESGNYERYIGRARLAPENWCFFMLTTTLEECLEHVRIRQRAAGKDGILKESLIKNLSGRWHSVNKVRDKIIAEPLNIQYEDVPLVDRMEIFEELLDRYYDI